MAIIKHKAMKSADYNAAIEYLEFEHNASGDTVLDEYGLPQLRDHFIIEGINCEPISFQAECRKVNELYKKNLKRNEIKSHSYIISFDPRDPSDNALTLEDVQQFGMEFANKYMPGYQTIVCSHADGNNGSGNMHCHIVINSIRIMDVEREPYMDQYMDNIAGGKHRCTPEFEQYIKSKVMEMCQERGLYQVNLLEPSAERINDREYFLNLRGKQIEGENYQTRKEFIRSAIRDCAGKCNNLNEFKQLMKSIYDIKVHESRGRLSYILPGRERGITDRKLGTIYTKVFLDKVLNREEVYYDRSVNEPYKTRDYVPPSVKKLVDIASNEKAQQSKGYEHAILISNLKKTAEMINVLSEKGISGMDELDHALSDINTRFASLTKEIKNVELRIAEVKNAMDLREEINRIQPIVDKLKNGKESAAFRKEHEADLIIYKAVHAKLKNADPELNDISENDLSAKLEKLLEMKNSLYEQRSQIKKDIRDLENAKHNLQSLSGKESQKQHEKKLPEPEK